MTEQKAEENRRWALRIYEDRLLDKSSFTLPEEWTKKEKERCALEVVRYAVTGFLKWEPESAILLNSTLMKQLCLNEVAEYVVIPKRLKERERIEHLLTKAFPEIASQTDGDWLGFLERWRKQI